MLAREWVGYFHDGVRPAHQVSSHAVEDLQSLAHAASASLEEPAGSKILARASASSSSLKPPVLLRASEGVAQGLVPDLASHGFRYMAGDVVGGLAEFRHLVAGERDGDASR